MARGKNIVLFSDGTGNSSAKLFKTNVWRTYEALDLSPPQKKGDPHQIAYYDDGVGTSTFRPIALLGGIFGVGLRRNVLDLYRFLCRNYEDGDRIYIFGFSRGAFTARVLAGLIASEGVLASKKEEDLERDAKLVYRNFRRQFNRAPLPKVYRAIRDFLSGKPEQKLDTIEIEKIAFVGVWDTVAAYGLPIAELTRAVDDWIWQLSMPDYVLSPKVQVARHAIALDDERDTFYPLLWDEKESEKLWNEENRKKPGRIKQVWFAGMHSDVGGGYPDEALSYVSLNWMLDEATSAGLKFLQIFRQRFTAAQSPHGPIHNSRRGLASYYRYQPRRISAYLAKPDISTISMRDPERELKSVLRNVNIHNSVIERIYEGTDNYAPIGIPANFAVVGKGKAKAPKLRPKRYTALQDEVFDDVWRRRIGYFTLVFVSLALLSFPWWADAVLGRRACEGWICIFSPFFLAVGKVLPAILEEWFASFARHPILSISLLLAIWMIWRRSQSLKLKIIDTMGGAWRPDQRRPAAGGIVRKIRTSLVYQKALQGLKWHVAPYFLGLVLLTFLLLLVFFFVWTSYHRTSIWRDERTGVLCKNATVSADGKFHTSSPCTKTGLPPVEAGVRYRVKVRVTSAWTDRGIQTNPEGFESNRMGALRYFVPFIRRSITDKWFVPILLVKDDKKIRTYPLDMVHAVDSVYVAEFTPKVGGEVFITVNDALPLSRLERLPGDLFESNFYDNNQGEGVLTLEKIDDPNNQRSPLCEGTPCPEIIEGTGTQAAP